MKRLAGLLLCLGCLGVVSAQDEAEHVQWMKSLQGEMGAMRKIENKMSPEMAVSAAKLSGIYETLAAYYTKKNVADAAKMSMDGKTAADEAVAAIKAGDAEKAGAAFKTVGGTCKGCHDVHREKAADGSYKFK